MPGEQDHEVLVRALSRPEAWGADGPVEVITTHASVVFRVGARAFKVKRPVDLGFLDFSTLDRRRSACEAEVRLNRRLAPGVYLGTAPITADPRGPRLRGEGAVLEWAVEMVRLDDADTLASHLERGAVGAADLRQIAHRLARFHAEADHSPEIAAYGRFEVVASNARENLEQTRDQVGRTVHPAVHARLETLTEVALADLRRVIERRAAHDVIRDTHGDLRVDHVYLLPQGPVVLDCIEFSERFRYADPVSDLAFLVMDMAVRGHGSLAEVLTEAWFDAPRYVEGRELLAFYVAYRSLVRAKVAGLMPDAPAVRARARRHWLYALATLESPARRPALVGIGGLPGTGKSTLASGLARAAGFEVVRSDVVRHALAGDDTRAGFGQGVYTEAGKDRVYRACLDRAEALLSEGRRVIVDASFWRERWRAQLVDRAEALGVPAAILLCEAPRDTALARLRARRDDPSDADEGVYLRALDEWEPPTATGVCRPIRTDGTREAVLADAVQALASLRLASAARSRDRVLFEVYPGSSP